MIDVAMRSPHRMADHCCAVFVRWKVTASEFVEPVGVFGKCDACHRPVIATRPLRLCRKCLPRVFFCGPDGRCVAELTAILYLRMPRRRVVLALEDQLCRAFLCAHTSVPYACFPSGLNSICSTNNIDCIYIHIDIYIFFVQ